MKIFKKTIVYFILVLIFSTSLPIVVVAASPNTTLTFSFNRRGWNVRTQDAFLPDRNVTTLGMDAPQSMVFGNNDLLYIADTGNHRILVFDTRINELANEIIFDEFVSPRGVFVTRDDWLYVADAGAGAVFILDALTGEHIRTHGAPTAMAFADTPFAPNRIAVDIRGNMFIIGEGVFDGIIQLSNGGEFLGFFASNRATRTFVQMLQDFFFTDRQREGLADRLPSTFSNLTIDGRGVVYTASIQTAGHFTGESLQRHDMAGRNTFESIPFSNHIDVAVDSNGFIYTATVDGWITVFSNAGEIIFYFGAGHLTNTDIAGWFRNITSIAVSSDGHLWVLDNESNFLQSFTPMSYAQSVFEAITLFNAGRYQESEEVWGDVLQRNQMSVLSHVGLGRAHLYQQDFEQAMESFYLGGNRFYYSAAFWEVRNQWLMNNLTSILLGIAALFFGLFILKLVDRRRVVKTAASSVIYKIMTAPVLQPALFAFTVARHPIDSYYYMKRKEKGSLGGAVFHFLLFFTSYMVFQTSRGFLVQHVDVIDMDFAIIIGGFIGSFVLFIISNYLVTSINDGEGGIVDIFKLVSYGLFPLTITLFGVTLISHVITLNEVFLYSFMLYAGGAYSLIVIWLGLQETHDYEFGQNFKSLLITVGFMLIAIIVLFNLMIMFNEIVEFIESIGREAYINVTGMY